jgi:uncharacterized membrane protein
MMYTLWILVRLVHIFAGVFWAGTSIALAGFITPTARALGPEGGKFVQRLVGPARLSVFMDLAALATTLSGLLLYWRDSGFQLDWIATKPGLVFTLGGLAGIATFVLGLAVMKPTAARVKALGQALQTAGGPPSPSQMTEMRALQERLAMGGLWGAVLLAVAVFAMSTARFLW